MATATATAEPAPRRWRLRLPERLPDLKGIWLTLYTIVWAIMLPLALMGAVLGTSIGLRTPTMWTPYGIATSDSPSGLPIDAVPGDEARAAGLRPGDTVIAVDGWEIPRSAGRSAAREHVVKPDGETTNFTVRKANGQIVDVRLTRSIAIEEESFRRAGLNRTFGRAVNAVGSALLPLLFISAAVLLFLRKRREAVPALLSVSFLIFGAIVNGADLLGVPIGIINIAASAGISLLYAALFAFPSGRFEPRWTAIPFLLLFPAAFIDAQQSLGLILGAGFSLLVIAALIGRYRRVGPGTERLQLRWAFLGLVAGVILSMLSLASGAAVVALQGEDPRWIVWQYVFVQTLGTWGLGIMALGLIISILRYRLYDADTVIGRSAAYGVLTVGFVALFAASQKIIELIGQQYLGQNLGGLAGGIGAAMAAVAIAPMHNRAQRWAERRFQNALYRLRHGLPALVGDLRETSGLEQIAGATLDSLVDGVRAKRAALVAGDQVVDAREIAANDVKGWLRQWSPAPHDGIDCDRSDETFPVRVPLEAEGHGRVGWLLLGPRPDGSLFGKSEFDAIEEVAEPVARAVQVVTRRQEREADLDERFRALESAIARLESRLTPRTA